MSAQDNNKKTRLTPALSNQQDSHDQRAISFRWFFSILIIGLFATGFVALSLFSITHGHVQLAKLARFDSSMAKRFTNILDKEDLQTDRILFTVPRQRFENKKTFEFSSEEMTNDKKVVKPRTFAMVHLTLAESRAGHFNYPAFNALSLFADNSDYESAHSISKIYQNKKTQENSEIIVKNINFDTAKVNVLDEAQITKEESKLNVRKSFSRFSPTNSAINNILYNYLKNNHSYSGDADNNSEQKQSNVSYLHGYTGDQNVYSYREDLLPLVAGQSIKDSLLVAKYNDHFSTQAAQVLSQYVSNIMLQKGGIVRLGLDMDEDGNETVIRASFYQKNQHIATVALNDNDQFVRAAEPEVTSIIKKALSGNHQFTVPVNIRKYPLYDSIYRATLSYNLSQDMIKKVIRIVASDIDLQGITNNGDTIDIFYPENDDGNNNILYIKAYINDKVHKYYRYKSLAGSVEYYNEDGKSSKQFLLRKPVPAGHFSSPFGIRRHPILGYVRMHTGVDWAAPLHSIIVAAGDGVVTKMGPMLGYGNHTEIQHANGFMTSYSHQSGFAAGIRPGVHVRQGQIIGYIGSTGLSTGAHCHFEILVNGRRVNPMRVHLPSGHALTGRDLILFQKKRSSIDTALQQNKF